MRDASCSGRPYRDGLRGTGIRSGHTSFIASTATTTRPAIGDDPREDSRSRAALPPTAVQDHAHSFVSDRSDPCRGASGGVGVDDRLVDRPDNILREDRRREEKNEREDEFLHQNSITQIFWVPLLAIASMMPV
jgi:hypothetical protein